MMLDHLAGFYLESQHSCTQYTDWELYEEQIDLHSVIRKETFYKDITHESISC